MAQADMRDIVMIAGEDPYAYKVTVDLNQPHVRPDRKGGCGHTEENVETTQT